MQKTFTLLQQSEDDQFADNSKYDAEVDTPLSSVYTGILFYNLWFADDIDLLGGSEVELQQLTERLKKTAADYSMEFSCDKSKIFVSSIKPRGIINRQMNGKC